MEKNVLLTDSGRPLVAPTENSRESLFFYSSPLFSVMLSLSKHLAEAYLSNSSHHTFYYSLNFLPRKQSLQKQRHYLTLAEQYLNNGRALSRGRRKTALPDPRGTKTKNTTQPCRGELEKYAGKKKEKKILKPTKNPLKKIAIAPPLMLYYI